MFDSTIPAHLLRQRVYLLHFITPYKHARHYLGVAEDVSARLDQHRRGTGARLTQVARAAGISWVVARTWRGGRRLEHRLKGWHSGVRLCPICQGKITLEEVLEAQPAPGGRVVGRRQPMVERPVRMPNLDCAWCLSEQGIAPGNGSHGICARHAAEQYARYRTSKEHGV